MDQAGPKEREGKEGEKGQGKGKEEKGKEETLPKGPGRDELEKERKRREWRRERLWERIKKERKKSTTSY